jgi:RHS repeat-associated protein
MDYSETVSAASPGAVTRSFRSVRGESDSETGLYYYRARYYDPTVGRFVSEDPTGFEGGVHFYDYVRNGPPSWADPFGLQALSYPAIAGLVAANNRSGQSDELIICIIWKESSNDPKGQNPHSSAHGLMGVENGAAQDLGVDPTTLSDPGINISVGTTYLHRRIAWRPPFGSGGNVARGLAKYGTGPGYARSLLRCEKCLKQNSNENCDTKKAKCLVPLHGGKQ